MVNSGIKHAFKYQIIEFSIHRQVLFILNIPCAKFSKLYGSNGISHKLVET